MLGDFKQFPSNDTMDKSFLTADVKDLVKQMTTEEKISLLAGRDWWNTVPVPRLNVPSVKVTDGPNGARGDSFFKMTPASAIPCATAVGAAFDPDLVAEAGSLLASETKARNAVCLLGPTINIQRSPLGGRAFESFSEDPTHSGLTAAAYINGLQQHGISATVKHFVANDQEHERNGSDSVVAERPLREVYLRPFQIAQKLAKPWAYMTSYNKLNGLHCSENTWLLQTILRKEWGFDGLIMSDWYGTYSVSDSINAGMNLEMPGSARWREKGLVSHLINAHKIDRRQIDKLAIENLHWIQKLAKTNEDLVYAKPKPERTRTEDKDADAEVIRKVGAAGIVLLKNENQVLPIDGANGNKKIAIIGPNAKARVLTGGGSALLRSAWSVSPWEGFEGNKPKDVTLDYSLGASTSKFAPIFDESFTDSSGKVGFDLLHYKIVNGKQDSKPTVTMTHDYSEIFLADFYHPDLGPIFFSEAIATFTSPVDGEYEFALSVTGQGWLWVDEKLVIDNSRNQKPGSAFFGTGTEEVKGKISVEKGKKYKIRALHDGRKPEDRQAGEGALQICAMRIGALPAFHPDQAIADAVELAKQSDVAVVVAGLNSDWESEGYDRPTLDMPLRSNELIEKVAEANPKTVVVIQAGSAVAMPWIDKVAGVVYAWYGGNETGNAIADVVYGKVNPAGRLPITLPVRQEDISANLNYKSARTKIFYEEGIWVGYKHHNARKIAPLFPFGHGLSYTTFEYSDLKVTPADKGASPDEWKIKASVTVKNTGRVQGDHSVHFYTAPPRESATGLRHPSHSLQGYKKVKGLAPGKSETVEVTLDKYAVSHWDDGWKTWRAEIGEWAVKVGKDAQTLYGDAKFTIEDELEWVGL